MERKIVKLEFEFGTVKESGRFDMGSLPFSASILGREQPELRPTCGTLVCTQYTKRQFLRTSQLGIDELAKLPQYFIVQNQSRNINVPTETSAK